MSKISKLFVSLLLFILILFLFFPAWSGWILKSQLPADINLLNLETGYPGFKSISIDHLQLKTNDMIITIDDLELNYRFSKIVIGKILIQKEHKQPLNGDVFKLPIFNIDDLNILDKFKSISIGKLNFNDNDTQMTLSVLKFLKTAEKIYQINFDKAEIQGQQLTSLEIQATVNSRTKKLDLKIKNQSDFLAEVSYQLTDELLKLIAKVDIDILQSVADYQLQDLPLKPQGLMDINIIQDRITGELDLLIKNILQLSTKEQQAVVIRQVEEKQSEIIRFPMVMKVSSKSVALPLTATVKVTSESISDLQLLPTSGRIITAPFKMRLFSELMIDKNKTDDLQLRFSKNNFELTMDWLKLNSSDRPLEIKIDDIKLKTIVDDFQRIISTKEIENSDTIKFKTTTDLEALSIQGDYEVSSASEEPDEKKLLKFTAKPAMNFELDFSNDIDKTMYSTGELLLKELKISDATSYLNTNLQLAWKKIVPDLSTGNLVLELLSDDGNIAGINVDDLTLNSDLKFSENMMSGEGKLLLNNHVLTPFKLKFDRKSNDTLIELNANQLQNQLLNQFLTLLSVQNKIELQIIDGEISHKGSVLLSKKMNVESKIDVENMSFQFGENTISGINTNHIIHSIEPLEMLSELQIDNVNFASGIELNNLKANIQSLSKDELEIRSLKGETLEGSFKSDLIKTNADGFNKTLIKMKDISLTELVFFMDVPGLYGEGKISFNIPLTMQSGSFVVEEGSFKADGKGMIKYSNEQTEQNNEENIALLALTRSIQVLVCNWKFSAGSDGKSEI